LTKFFSRIRFALASRAHPSQQKKIKVLPDLLKMLLCHSLIR